MIAHSVHISVFTKSHTFQLENVIKNIFSFPVLIEKTEASGVYDDKIVILRVNLLKQKEIDSFLLDLKKKLTESLKTIISQLDSRIDENLNFFIRLDLESLLAGKYVLTDSGSCLHIRIHLAAFPKRKEIALKLILAYLS